MRRNQLLLQIVLLVVCVAVLAAYFSVNRPTVLAALQGLTRIDVLLVIFTVALQVGVRTFSDWLLFSSMGYYFSPFGLYFLQAQQNLLNYLPMKLGTVYIASRLKSRHGVALSHFVAIFLAQNILTLGVTLCAASVAWLLGAAPPEREWTVAGVLALMGLLPLLLLFLRLPFINRLPRRLAVFITMVHEGMDTLKRSTPLLITTLILRLITVLLMAWRLQILFSMEEQVSFSAALIFAAGVLVSMLLSITPAGLGVRELFLGAASGILAMAPAVGVLVSVVERLLVLAFMLGVVIVGSLLAWISGGRFSE